MCFNSIDESVWSLWLGGLFCNTMDQIDMHARASVYLAYF